MIAVGFEPTPSRTSALSWRLRPLGQVTVCDEVSSRPQLPTSRRGQRFSGRCCEKTTDTSAKRKRAYGTPDSHVVPHRSTDRACSGLTAQFGRDTVLFTEYGRRRMHNEITGYIYVRSFSHWSSSHSQPPTISRWSGRGAAAAHPAARSVRQSAAGRLRAAMMMRRERTRPRAADGSSSRFPCSTA